jgi:hypothetical protein
MTVENGKCITIKPTQRKYPTEAAKKPIVMLYEAESEINCVRAYREM